MNQSPIKDPVRIPARVCVCGAASDFDEAVRIEIRGSSSARDAVKKSFSFDIAKSRKKRHHESDIGLPPSFMGFPAGNTFDLYGPENDLTLGMRNWMSMWMARAMGRYASRTAWAEVYLMRDEQPAYWGLYIAMEKIERGSDRVNISALTPMSPDTSGGFIVRYEHGKSKNSSVTFTASLDLPSPTSDLISRHAASKIRPLPYLLVYPDLNEKKWNEAADIKTSVLSYISEYMSLVELSFINLASGFNNSSISTMIGPNDTFSLAVAASRGIWRSLVDEPAFIDYFFITEISKNPDGYRGSVYASKDKDAPLAMGPAWDYNEAYGLCCGYPIDGYQREGKSNGTSGGSAISSEGWRFNICEDQGRCKEDPIDGVSRWYQMAFQLDPAFRLRLSQRWIILRGSPLSDQAVLGEMGKQLSLISVTGAAAGNYERWAAVLGSFDQYGSSANEIRSWLMNRLHWMDHELNSSLTSIEM